MKYTSSILALGLAGTAVATSTDTTCDEGSVWVDWSTSSAPADSTKASSSADPSHTWADWSSSSSPAAETKSSKSADPSHTWADWSSSSSPAAETKSSKSADPTWADWSASSAPADSTTAKSTPATITVTKYDSTSEVYKTTVTVGPGDCTKTVYPSSCSSKAADPSSSYAWNDWTSAASSTSTVTVTKTGTTTEYKSTLFVGPGGCKSTVTSSCGAAASSAPAAGSWAPGSSAPAAASGKTTAVVSPTGGWAAPTFTKPLDAGISKASIIGSNSQVFTWTGDVKPASSASAAPTYAGWGDWHGSGNGTGSGANGTGPAPGTDASNVTKPFEPLADSSCNSAADRSKWCGKYSIDTDYYNESPNTGKVCSANWVITNTTLNYDGVPRLALAINGQVPGPLLECNWGDTITVTVTNQMKDNATTIHWHGVLQKGTNDQDGVPGISECAIAPGQTRTYSYKADQYGTGWYHSHVYTQYGDGIRGPMVIHGPATANYDVDAGTVMIDDLFGIPQPMSVAETNARVAHYGPVGTWNYMLNGANTSPDLSKGKHALWKVKSGKKYLFRLINSASANMWSVHFDNHKMKVIATDYVPIKPYTTEWLNIGIGQRYDVIVEMNQPKAGYFLRAAMQTGCPSGGPNNGLGQANGMFVYDDAPLTLPTSTAGNKTATDFAICADEPLASLVPYLKKGAGDIGKFQASAAQMPAGLIAQVNTPDDGTVFRWFINNGAINTNFSSPTLQTIAYGTVSNTSVSNYVTLNVKNQWVYFVIQNQFFAAHPMHLHGHDMSILGQGTTAWNPSLVSTLNFDNPARRDTAMLAGAAGPGSPPGYTVIGFETDNPGAWVMHCHIIWHVDGGLAMQFIERPDDMHAKDYCSKSSFTNECKGLGTYEAEGSYRIHSSGSSGLKARFAEEMLKGNMAMSGIVRKSAEREYLDNYVRRGLSARHARR